MKSMLSITMIGCSLLISACSATPTKDLNTHNLRVADISNYDTSIIATFCGTKEFNNLFIDEPYPKIYTKLKTTKNYLDFKSSIIHEFDPVKYEIWIGDVDLENFYEYRDCGKDKIYPYIYWFKLDIEKNMPYEKKENYIKYYNEFKDNFVKNKRIEVGVVQLSGFNGNDLVSEESGFLYFSEEQYGLLKNKIQ